MSSITNTIRNGNIVKLTTVRKLDTAAERCRYTRIMPVQMSSGGVTSFWRFFSALVGLFCYCQAGCCHQFGLLVLKLSDHHLWFCGSLFNEFKRSFESTNKSTTPNKTFLHLDFRSRYSSFCNHKLNDLNYLHLSHKTTQFSSSSRWIWLRHSADLTPRFHQLAATKQKRLSIATSCAHARTFCWMCSSAAAHGGSQLVAT